MDIRAIIVDDEEPAREEIKNALQHFPEIKVIGVFDDVINAFNFISNNVVDVIFLDINMPGISGIKFVSQSKEIENFPYVVFVTAYAEYAVDAFEIGALDYILKPVDEARLAKTVIKLRGFLNSRTTTRENFIIGVSNGELIPVKLKDIDYFFVEKNKLFFKKGKDVFYVKGISLQEVEDRLKDFGFFRINKEYVINLSKISKVIPWFKGKYIIEIQNGDKLPLSPHRQKYFRDILKF
ncbi:MAG: LytTR family DNA-binding domain-containing protein [Caldisericaceae bacterium]